MACLGWTLRDESDPEIRQHMLEYMISLMDDANDFSWISAKASHAVLLCRMEQGEVKSHADTLAIDRIRRAYAQTHVTISQTKLFLKLYQWQKIWQDDKINALNLL